MKKPNHKPLREDRRASTSSNTPTRTTIGMEPATVTTFDARRGSGQAIVRSSGRKVRIPLSALRAANIPVLSPGDAVYVELDFRDRNRVEVIRVADA